MKEYVKCVRSTFPQYIKPDEIYEKLPLKDDSTGGEFSIADSHDGRIWNLVYEGSMFLFEDYTPQP